MEKSQENMWIWDKTKIVLKDPQGKEVILSSLNLPVLTSMAQKG